LVSAGTGPTVEDDDIAGRIAQLPCRGTQHRDHAKSSCARV
jgi:hypothetical protein